MRELCKRNKGCWLIRVVSQKALHPYHVKPSIKLIAALFESRAGLKTETLMKMDARVIKVLIFCIAIGNTGVGVVDILRGKECKKTFIESSPYAITFMYARNINRSLNGVNIRNAGAKCRSVSLPYNLAVKLGHNIGVTRKRCSDATLEFSFRWHIVFKCDGRLLNIRRINLLDAGGICRCRNAYDNLIFHALKSNRFLLAIRLHNVSSLGFDSAWGMRLRD